MGSLASLRRIGDSALRASCHLAQVPWLLSLRLSFAHGRVSTKSTFPKEFCAVGKGHLKCRLLRPTSEMPARCGHPESADTGGGPGSMLRKALMFRSQAELQLTPHVRSEGG